MLASLKEARTQELFASLSDGRAKMLATWKLLQLRREREALFVEGDLVPLKVRGTRGAHVVAFARRHASGTLLVIVPRLVARLGIAAPALPCGRSVWGDASIAAPFLRDVELAELFTGATHRVDDGRIDVADALAMAPVAAWFA